jgi:hypothetical protein
MYIAGTGLVTKNAMSNCSVRIKRFSLFRGHLRFASHRGPSWELYSGKKFQTKKGNKGARSAWIALRLRI